MHRQFHFQINGILKRKIILLLQRLHLTADEFMLNAESGHYERYVFSDGKDYGIGMPYKFSVCRYFGTGKEESDYAGQTGPNIEFDYFGLSLIACCNYVYKSGDIAFFSKNYTTPILRRMKKPLGLKVG